MSKAVSTLLSLPVRVRSLSSARTSGSVIDDTRQV